MKKVLGCFSQKSSHGNTAAPSLAANTPPYKNHVASRLFLAVLFMLAGIQGVWGTTVPGTFTEINSVEDFTSGYYIIVPSKDVDRNKDYAMGGRLNSGTAKYIISKSISYTTETTIVNPEDSIVYKIGVSASGISFKNYATSKYLYQNNTASSRLAFNDDECYFLHGGDSIKYSDTKPQGFCLETTFDSESSTSRHFKYISADISKYFANYSGAWTSTANTPVRLFKLTSTFTVTFETYEGSCDTTDLTESSPLSGVKLPALVSLSESCTYQGWSFIGWAETSCSETTKMPTIYQAGSIYHPSDDCTLYAVYRKENEDCTSGVISSTGDLSVGDNVLLIYASGSKQYDVVSGSYGAVSDYTTTPDENHILEVKAGSTDGKLAFYDLDAKAYLAYNGNFIAQANVNATSSWTVEISEGDASITNASYTAYKLQYYPSNPRFNCYNSEQKLPQLYKLCYIYNSDPVCGDCEASPTIGNPTLDGFTISTISVTCPSIGAGVSCGIKDYGFVWETGDAPSISDNKTQVGTNNQFSSFSADLSVALTAGTTYYIKAYAINNGENTTLSSTALIVTPRSVTWMLNGEEYSSGGTTILLDGQTISSMPSDPNMTGFCADKFIGWTDAADGEYIHGTSNLYTEVGDFPAASGNQIFYAVFVDILD